MDYKLNMGQWNSIFVIPKSVVDKHIKLVGSTQLKVLLWILRYSDENFSIDKISKSLFIHPTDVKDALQYWIESGILIDSNLEIDDNNSSNKKSDIDIISQKVTKKECFSKTAVRKETDGEYIAGRIDGCKDISFIMKEAEVILGDKFSRGIIPVLVSFYDNDGLPADVIVMILQYAVKVGKTSVRYIEKVGISWAKEGIDTIEKAEEKIKFLDNMNVVKERFEKLTDNNGYRYSSGDLKIIDRWFNEWGYDDDSVRQAYDICMKIKGKFILKYVDGIIKSWKNDETYDNVHTNRLNHTGANKKDSSDGRRVSYSIEDYENYWEDVLIGKKKSGE